MGPLFFLRAPSTKGARHLFVNAGQGAVLVHSLLEELAGPRPGRAREGEALPEIPFPPDNDVWPWLHIMGHRLGRAAPQHGRP